MKAALFLSALLLIGAGCNNEDVIAQQKKIEELTKQVSELSKTSSSTPEKIRTSTLQRKPVNTIQKKTNITNVAKTVAAPLAPTANETKATPVIDPNIKIAKCNAEMEISRKNFEGVLNEILKIGYENSVKDLDSTLPCEQYLHPDAIVSCLQSHRTQAYNSALEAKNTALRQHEVLLQKDYLNCLNG